MALPYILLSILWLALSIYTVTGGADFGAGMLELFAVGPTGARQDALIDESVSHEPRIQQLSDGYCQLGYWLDRKTHHVRYCEHENKHHFS